MTSESREQILFDFQDCTSLENVEECIQILEQHQWNLIDAIQAVHERIGDGHGESTVPVEHPIDRTNSNIINNKRQSDSNDMDNPFQPRIMRTVPDNQPIHYLCFIVEYCDKKQRIMAFDNETIYDLKKKINQYFPVPPEKQQFMNWTLYEYDDQTILKDMHLSNENEIYLSGENSSQTYQHTTSSTQYLDELPLTVLYKDPSEKLLPCKLVLSSRTTILDMKQEIEKLLKIPLHEQIWQGLLGIKDSDELSKISISSGTQLIVTRSDTSLNQQLPTYQQSVKRSIVKLVSSDDEYVDASQDTNVHSLVNDDDNDANFPITFQNTTTMEVGGDRQPLMPDECTDDISALEIFFNVFQMRYGSQLSMLYIGSLDEALQNSLYSSIHSRRPLAIYLHNDQSVCTNVFCSQVLCAESILQYLSSNYVFWAWDVTYDSNRTRLFETLRRCIGQQCVQRVNSIGNDLFPLILILVRSRGSLELINVIEGTSSSSEVLLNLIQSHESFEQQRLRDVDEEILRENRETLKRQQEDEYEQSLQADLAKERARKEEEIANEKIKQQRLKQQKESKERLPEEPNETEKNITRLKIRLPDDDGILMRRFRINDNLQTLFDYLCSEGRMLGEYKLLTTYPKRDLTSLNSSDTFEQLKLYPQEQLILESL